MSRPYEYEEMINALQDEIHSLGKVKTQMRKREKNLGDRERALEYALPGLNSSNLLSALTSLMPTNQLPRNVGPLEVVNWNEFYQFDFDFGVNPTLNELVNQTQFIEVTQEAAFLATRISVNFQESESVAGGRGPWQLEIRNNQSGRYLNAAPVPAQTFGSNSRPTELPIPFMFQPKGTISVRASTWLTPGESIVTVGTGKFSFSMWGIRVRVDDSQYPALDAFFRASE